MKVVLVTKIKNLGNIGDIVDVKSGFARNFLLPYHKALPATDEYIKDFEEKKEEYLKKAQDELSLAEANAISIKDLKLTISANAQESGTLFGSVGVNEILDAMHAEGHDFITKSSIILLSGPIKEVGEFTINVELHPEIVKSISIEVKPT
ncbi:MAG: 50S ribosomal protein L9 [Gammaproteobacteria bacterium]|uniref:Large ribosomal subunit protein bL9 n=1 Tax=SAR86 cluster bacterium TaxID=2030880 RepID=A0A520MTE5_9GAMM|nr:50S ribosomal protein L9 [Gammaproteobacteria bacterium]RZO24466.1 MAG: 50S ribosomal protein L9 [SAR86 cluster bacterium]|tara:strand:- start:681 stop:1130 length:450 start_codon:yes stop_codon:yes gene_type:complete